MSKLFTDSPEWKLQQAEFEAVGRLAQSWRTQPAIVDDDYPRWRFEYERSLFNLIKAVRANHGDETFNIRSR